MASREDSCQVVGICTYLYREILSEQLTFSTLSLAIVFLKNCFVFFCSCFTQRSPGNWPHIPIPKTRHDFESMNKNHPFPTVGYNRETWRGKRLVGDFFVPMPQWFFVLQKTSRQNSSMPCPVTCDSVGGFWCSWSSDHWKYTPEV